MADEDYFGDWPEATSQGNFGLASNPLMPMGDPMAYARTAAAPEVSPFASTPAIHTQGVPLPAQQRITPPSQINVPDIPGPRGGGEAPNQLQPSQAPPDSGMNLNSLQGLLQMKGMSDLLQPAAAPVERTPGGAVAVPGAGAGPGRSPTGVSIEKAAAPYKDMVNDAAKQSGVDPQTLTRLLYRESQFDPKAVSPAGAKGIGQFMDATAKEEGVDVKDPKSSIYGSAKYLRKMTDMFNGNEQLGMAAYNWGPGNVHNWLKNGADPSKLPAETRDYVNAISGRPLAPNTKPTAGAAPGPTSQADQPFKPYMIAGAMQPPPTSATTTPSVFGEHKPGQMSPFGGPYTTVQADGSQYATDADGKIVGPPIKDITTPKFDKDKTEDKTKPEGKQPATKVVGTDVGPSGERNDQGTPNLGGGVTQPQINPDKIVPGATPPVEAKPGQDQPQQQQPAQTPAMQGFGQDPAMQKLWRYMLIKSLFPQIQFRNVGYDPWAVHRFGQSGGY